MARLGFVVGVGREVLRLVRLPRHLDVGLAREVHDGEGAGFLAELLQRLFREGNRAVAEAGGGGDDDDALGFGGESGERRAGGQRDDEEERREDFMKGGRRKDEARGGAVGI